MRIGADFKCHESNFLSSLIYISPNVYIFCNNKCHYAHNALQKLVKESHVICCLPSMRYIYIYIIPYFLCFKVTQIALSSTLFQRNTHLGSVVMRKIRMFCMRRKHRSLLAFVGLCSAGLGTLPGVVGTGRLLTPTRFLSVFILFI